MIILFKLSFKTRQLITSRFNIHIYKNSSPKGKNQFASLPYFVSVRPRISFFSLHIVTYTAKFPAMSMHFVDPLAKFAMRNAEEKFKLRDTKGAIVCATMAKTLDPNVDGIDETLVAYKIHQVASKKHGNNGAPNWYAVLGIKEGFEDIESVTMQYNKLVKMVNPTKNASVATWGAHRLINKAWRNLCDPNRLSNKRMKGSRGIKVTKRACPRCRKWCKYEVPRVSSSGGHKHGEYQKIKTVLVITCSSCKFKFDPISGKTPNSTSFGVK